MRNESQADDWTDEYSYWVPSQGREHTCWKLLQNNEAEIHFDDQFDGPK